ncbi:MAG: hypothetical protein KJ767_01095 [Nanoarchaeota archaeon]|nr:hypothetical protein [Nanoarchaeota archaeon]
MKNKKENVKGIALFQIILMVSLSIIVPLSISTAEAQEETTSQVYCIQKFDSGATCQTTSNLELWDRNSAYALGRCEDNVLDSCVFGSCTKNGVCNDNVPKFSCDGSFETTPCPEIESAQKACYIIGNQYVFTTSERARQLAVQYGIPEEQISSVEGIESELSCSAAQPESTEITGTAGGTEEVGIADCTNTLENNGVRGTRQHGEEWCVRDYTGINGKAPLGGRFWKLTCINGEQIVTPCADERQEVCREVETTLYGGITEAACQPNNWKTCLTQETKEDCEGTSTQSCFWYQPKKGTTAYEGFKIIDEEDVKEGEEYGLQGFLCLPKTPPGFNLASLISRNATEEQAEENAATTETALCNQASFTCTYVKKKAILGGTEEDNPECLTSEWQNAMNDRCMAIGDCGASVNLMNEPTQDGYSIFKGDQIDDEQSVEDWRKTALNIKLNSAYLNSLQMEILPLKKSTFFGGGAVSILGNILKEINGFISDTEFGGPGPDYTTYTEYDSIDKKTKETNPEMYWKIKVGDEYVDVKEFITYKKEGKVVKRAAVDKQGNTYAPSTGTDFFDTAGNAFTATLFNVGSMKLISEAGKAAENLIPATSKDELGNVMGNLEISEWVDSSGNKYKYIGEVGGSGAFYIESGGKLVQTDVNVQDLKPFEAGAGGQGGTISRIKDALKPIIEPETLQDRFLSATTFMMLAKVFGAKDRDALIIGVGGFIAGAVGAGIATVVVLLLNFLTKKKVKEIKTIEFRCMPTLPPQGGSNCELCNQDDLRPCSEYRCLSLGTTCEYIDDACVSVESNDVTKPYIANVSVSKYEVSQFVEGRNAKITKADGSCLDAFQSFDLTLTTSEAAKCNYDIQSNNYEDMLAIFGSGLFKLNHKSNILTGGITEANITVEPGRAYKYYIRCRDVIGNTAVTDFVLDFCVDTGPDLTPARINRVEPVSGSFVPATQINQQVKAFVNEPAECRWSTQDTSYEDMINQFKCAIQPEQMQNGEWLCTTTLSGFIENKENKYYFRCKDKPLFPESERNVNTQSYVYTLNVGKELVITSVLPVNTTFTTGKNGIDIELQVTTAEGSNDGTAICMYSLTGGTNEKIFTTTGSTSHTTKVNLKESKTIYVRCQDPQGNSAKKQTAIVVNVDTTIPIITRVYTSSGNLVIVTDETTTCKYSSKSTFAFTDETAELFGENSIEHSVTIPEYKAVYVKCQDIYGNEISRAIEPSPVS